MSEIQTGRVGPITCPVCDSNTMFWMQENGRAMCPCTARRTIDASNLPDSAAATSES